MERLFKTHYIREQECLDGIWDFEALDSFRLPHEYTDTMAVPSCWEMSIKYVNYTGCAAYRKVISVKKNSNLRFVFKGVSHTCKVYFDGAELGGHYSAYSAFSVVAKGVTAGQHTLEVLVDNAYSEQSRLHIPNDYFTYGGITRPVFMEYIPDCYIERTEFEPEYTDGKWSARVRVFVNNISDNAIHTKIGISCASGEILLDSEIEPNKLNFISGYMSFDDIKPWSPDSPSLYEVKYTIDSSDDLIDRVGFRIITIENKKVLINGEPVFIKGVNRHEDHGINGCAIPLQIMYSDIALIKELSANAVRTSHYQNDERFLDLCDENGIMVWEESHDRGGTVERLTHPLFLEQSMNSMHEMLEYHYNHPSIIMWGCLNEAASDTEEGREIYKTHLDYLATDKSRPHTYASNKHANDICLDMADICSMNIYPLWYDDTETGAVLNRIKGLMKETGNDHKPLIISEYGAGGIYNFHDVMRVRWSEEYQADVMDTVTKELVSDESIAGIFIWQFCDTRVKMDAKRTMTRSKSRNNKGLVDEYRRPKMAYYAVKNIFNGTERGNIYAALYASDDSLLGVRMAKGADTMQTLKFPVPKESGTYMKIFNWTDDMKPLCDASKAIYTDEITRKNPNLPDNVNDTVDLAVFAGQSNMSGRGKAADATVCDINAGFEYKSISNPTTLVPVTEPFGLGEDKEGGIYDYGSDGKSKRTGSMVSAVVDEYYKQTGRQLVAVSASIGGTSTSEWKSNYINDAVERLDTAKKFLERNGITVGRTFIVWCQGESDGDAKMTAENYTANTKDLFEIFKQHGAEKCFMVQIGHYNYLNYSGTLNGLTGAEWDEKYGIIRDAQAALCETDEDFVLAGSFEPYISDMKDRYHYNQGTYNTVGKTVGASIAEFYK